MRTGDLGRAMTTGRTAAIEREIRRSLGTGRRLDDVARIRIEAAFGTGIGPIGIHDDETADLICRELEVEAVTTGSDVYVRSGRCSLGDDRSLRLVAHEAAHVVQQARVAPPIDEPWVGPALEAEADALAGEAVRGRRAASRVAPRAAASRRPVGTRPGMWLQGHGSWEHSLFGDTSVQELMALAADAADKDRRKAILGNLRDTAGLWRTDPGSVKAARLQEVRPGTRTFNGAQNQVLFTYGELNALPDYVQSPAAVGTMPAPMLLKILQSVRQESYNKLQALIGPSGTTPIVGGPTMLLQAWLNSSPVDFTGAASPSSRFGMVNLLMETAALDAVTVSLVTNRYLALVARNACHFAPFSWYRWRDSFAAAQDLARRAHAAPNPADRASLAFDAWMHAGYAAHFLQDSFAAGHLVNKTLIMQWFVEWATTEVWGPIPDWDTITTMTTSRQPGIAAPELYQPTPTLEAFVAAVRDPQTAEDSPTRGGRMALSGSREDGSINELQAYFNFLTFMGNPSAQAGAGAVHDYFNAHSLSVASVAHPAPFQLWGDDTMLVGGLGIEIASETTHRSMLSIADLTETGTTDMTIEVIFSHFPTSAALPSGKMVGLQEWQFSKEIHDLVATIFPSAHYYAGQLGTRVTNITSGGGTTTVGQWLSWLESLTIDTIAATVKAEGRIPDVSIDVVNAGG